MILDKITKYAFVQVMTWLFKLLTQLQSMGNGEVESHASVWALKAPRRRDQLKWTHYSGVI